MRRATPCTARTHCSQLFQSTLSMRRTTDDDPGQRHGYRISIHALHEESDMLRESEAYGPSSFQSTLSMRRATTATTYRLHTGEFQSTLSMRRAINPTDYEAIRLKFQSTLSMRRANKVVYMFATKLLFQSTLSMRRATGSWITPSIFIGYFNPRSP